MSQMHREIESAPGPATKPPSVPTRPRRSADQMRTPASCIYEGWVRHRRHAPRRHEFRYRLYMMYLDLAELPTLFDRYWLWSDKRPNLTRFRRRDHLKRYAPPEAPLDAVVRDAVESELGFRPAGPIRLLTHLEHFGYRFNPVSFYYCFDPTGTELDAVVAEINNTPWGEQHCYFLDARQKKHPKQTVRRFDFDKAFHISPFMSMDQRYRWQLSVPSDNISISMDNYENGRPVFNATLHLARRPITPANLARVLVSFPLITVKTIAGIYYQAFRLWLKRMPHHPHPDRGVRGR